jgi:hypothetical protein
MHEGKQQMVRGLAAFIRKFKVKKDKYGRLLLYKAVMLNRSSYWVRGPRAYTDNAEVTTKFFCSDRHQDCGPGLHISTYEFAKNFALGQPYAEHRAKIRCKKLRVIREVSVCYFSSSSPSF